jgi:hypothetical protein
MGARDDSRNGKAKRSNCVGLLTQDDLRLSSEYGEAQVSARRAGVTSLSMQEMGRTWGTVQMQTLAY